MQKIKKPISILLSVLMVLSVFAVVPFTASATETFETLDLTQHYDDYSPKSFNGERFSVQVYGDEADITADEAGWLFDGDYPGAYASISAMNGETITKIVVHRSDYDNTLIVKADDNTIPYSQNGDDFTYDNINASSVKLSADPDYPDDCYCEVSSIDVYYTGGSAPTTYTITWKNWDGTTLETDTDVAEGTTPTYDGTTPEKAEDENYTYTFAGWSPEVEAVTGDATYTATFTFSPSLVGRYVETPGRGASNTMVFPDCDVYITGVTGTQTIHNTSVTYSHSTAGSLDLLYFNGQEVYRGGWAVRDGIRIVSGSGTSSDPYVTEWYSASTITWKLDEDTVIDTTKVPFDAVPTHAAPTKEPDEEYTYTFAGWSPEPVAVTDDATYTATFTAVPRPYNVNVETAEHGTVTANPAEAAKGNQVTLTAEPDAGYALSSIKAFKKNTNSQQATLTALDGSSTGGEGYDKLVDGNTDTKWGFNGGSGYIIVKADKAFILNDYSLTTANDTNNYSGRNWKNWEIYGANFASDSEAVENSDQWQLVTSVTNDSKLQATNFTRYDYSVNTDPEAYQYYKIEISANKGDGYTQMSELTLSGANYDVEVVLMQDSADPAKYTFEMPASNVTVKAEFEAIPTYTVTWLNDDGTTIDTTSVYEGDAPTHADPTKAEDENYTYTFAGWTPEITAVTGDVTYTATFTATPKTPAATASYVKVTTAPDDWSGDYLIVYEDEDDGTAFNGSADSLNSSGNYIYVTISGGEIASDAATDAAKVTIAQIDGGYSIATATGAYIGGVSGQNKLDFRDEAILNTISLDNDGNAEIVSNNTYLRFNSAWSGFRYYRTVSQKPVQLYKLTGGSAPATYTVTWKNEDGSIIDTTEVEAGEVPTHADPTKDGDAQHTYTFAGWTPEVVEATADAEYTATFDETVNEYTITWKNEDGSVLKTDTVAYGETPAYDGETPEKEADAQYTYTFSGWTPEVAAVTGDATYTATFDETVNEYTITWKNEDGSVLKTDTVAYGETPAYDGETPAKDYDRYYYYTFAGWDVEPAAATGDAEYTAVFEQHDIPLPNGPQDDGYYYFFGEKQRAYTLVSYYDDYWYLVSEYHKYAKNQIRYLNASMVEGTDFAVGYYWFDEEGHMQTLRNGPQADGCFYINNERQSAYQLLEYEGDWYFVAENHKYAVNQTRYLNASVVEGTGFAAGYYEFDADGKMMYKNGPDADGYFYLNNEKQKAYKLISFEDNYYLVAEYNKYAKNQRRYLNAAMVEGTDLAVGYYEFDADGRLITA